MALALLMRFFNKFNRLSISALGLHAILLDAIGCIKSAVHAQDDDRTDIVIRGLVETSLSARFQRCEHSGRHVRISGNSKDDFQQRDRQGLCQRNADADAKSRLQLRFLSSFVLYSATLNIMKTVTVSTVAS